MRKILFISILVIIILISCATNIKDMNIAQTKVTIQDMDKNTLKKLLPDSIYNIIIRVTDTNGVEYASPNYRNFKINNLKKLKIEDQAFFSFKLKTSSETFHAAGTNAYSLNIYVKENNYPVMTYEYTLDWDNYDTLKFNGRNGLNGDDGDSGFTASGDSIDSVTGSSGYDGTDGKNGYSGKDIELLVLKYQYGNSEKILFYEINKEMVFLTDLKTITIDTSGGNGGQGGSGGNGGYGNSFTEELTDEVTEGIPGTPGDGGDGGNGGSGGDILLFAADPGIFTYLNPISAGGNGGIAGRSGKSYDNIKSRLYRGDRGKTGRDGWDGDIQFTILEKGDIDTILKSIKEEGFELSRVIY